MINAKCQSSNVKWLISNDKGTQAQTRSSSAVCRPRSSVVIITDTGHEHEERTRTRTTSMSPKYTDTKHEHEQ